MNQAEIQDFLRSFFKSKRAEMIHDEPGKITVHLTEELDEILMNRPFYWQYVRKLGKTGEPMNLTLITDHEKFEPKKGEWVHFGSPRLEQIFRIVKDDGAFTHLYEITEEQNNKAALHPWFISNILVQYRGHVLKDEIVSVGVLLINGSMRFQFMDAIQAYKFDESIPDYSYTLPTIIPPERAIDRVLQELEGRIHEKSDDFMMKSLALYTREINMIQQVMDNRTTEEVDLAKQHIYERLYPQVDLSWINCGLIYLTETSSKKLLKI